MTSYTYDELAKIRRELIKERDELQRENMGQSDLIERLLKECNEIRRQVEQSKIISKAFDNLVAEKNDKIAELESQTAALRGALEEAIKIIGTPYPSRLTPEFTCREGDFKRRVKALTASGENRYARIEEAARAFCRKRECHNCDRDNPYCKDGDCAIFAALGEGK